MLDEIDKSIILELQSDIPICTRPYAALAKRLKLSEGEVINRVHHLINTGSMRRFGAILNQRKAGFEANAMVVWQVSEESVQQTGNIMASFAEVTHCYQRPTLPEWPYNLYTMVHGSTRENCDASIQKIAEATAIDEYKILYSVIELKKISASYFENS